MTPPTPASASLWSRFASIFCAFRLGSFVARCQGRVVGYALTMRVNRSPYERPLAWIEAVGGLDLRNHDSQGEWMYGIDFVVDPTYRQRGIGTQLYQVRFALIRRLNLRGFYAGGMLRNYSHYAHCMTPVQYAEKVIQREVEDPTVTMQMNRGFAALGVIESYVKADNHPAMLIAWHNAAFRAARPAPVQRRVAEAQPALG
ncbi:MAG: GNAT family N-acetyltransferase [Anaerolineae bacterium]|nr:GNAT family N-acetyltransferase [Anaerolineae bacterium]